MLARIKSRWMMFRFRHIVLEAVVAVCLAFLIWMYTHSRAGDSTDFVQVPVQLQLPPGQRDQFAIESQGPMRVNVMFSGPYARIREVRRKIQRGAVQAIVTVTVPEDKQHENSYADIARVSIADLSVPPGVTVELADDNATIPITIHRLVERILPVRLDVTGEVRVSHVKLEPTTVTVRGPKSILDRVAFIPTQPCSLQADTENASAEPIAREQVALVTELEGRPIADESAQRASALPGRAQAEGLRAARRAGAFPLSGGLPAPTTLPRRPPGPGLVAAAGAGDRDAAAGAGVHRFDGGKFARGRNLEPLRLQLPKDFQLVQNSTILVPFALDEPDRPSSGIQQAAPP